MIGGACITNGTINPDVACEICSPINSTTEWTPSTEFTFFFHLIKIIIFTIAGRI